MCITRIETKNKGKDGQKETESVQKGGEGEDKKSKASGKKTKTTIEEQTATSGTKKRAE